MINVNKILFLFLAGYLVLLTGCTPAVKKIPPTLTLDEVVMPYNNSILAIEPVYATLGRWSGEIGVGKERSRHSDSGGKLFYNPPVGDELPRLYIQFDSPLKPKLLVVASDETFYGMYSEADDGSGAWGYHENIGKPCSQSFPVDIQALLETLGLKPIPLERIYSYKITEQYNIVEYVNLDNNLLYLHELCFDRFENVPKLINIYSRNGLLVATSNLDKFVTSDAGRFPLEIKLSYLPEKAVLEMKLKKYGIDKKDRSLLFEMALDKARQYEQLDADCQE